MGLDAGGALFTKRFGIFGEIVRDKIALKFTVLTLASSYDKSFRIELY